MDGEGRDRKNDVRHEPEGPMDDGWMDGWIAAGFAWSRPQAQPQDPTNGHDLHNTASHSIAHPRTPSHSTASTHLFPQTYML